VVGRLFCPGDEGQPFVLEGTAVEHVVGVGPGRSGWHKELHFSLPGSATGFAVVTGDAGSNDIVPGMAAAPEARCHVVQGQVPGLSPTVLTSVPVACEDLPSGETPLEQWTPHKYHQPYYGRGRKDGFDCVYFTTAVSKEFSFAPIQENHRPSDVTDVQRLVVLVQYQDR
jgi:hypothetical protein